MVACFLGDRDSDWDKTEFESHFALLYFSFIVLSVQSISSSIDCLIFFSFFLFLTFEVIYRFERLISVDCLAREGCLLLFRVFLLCK